MTQPIYLVIWRETLSRLAGNIHVTASYRHLHAAAWHIVVMCKGETINLVFDFLGLPLELRSDVYSELARSRELALLRACRQTHEEMRSIVEHEVPRRIHVLHGWPDDDNRQEDIEGSRASRAQNWEVYWTPSSAALNAQSCFSLTERWAAFRAESEVPRRRCVVFVVGYLGAWITFVDILALGVFARFKTVEFRNGIPDKCLLDGSRAQWVLEPLESLLELVLGGGQPTGGGMDTLLQSAREIVEQVDEVRRALVES